MSSKIRLYFSNKIQSELIAHLTKDQSHYVKDVMRLKAGDILSIFNSQGEWSAKIKNYQKDSAVIKVLKKIRNKGIENNVWLAFSPIKQNLLNFMIQKIRHQFSMPIKTHLIHMQLTKDCVETAI